MEEQNENCLLGQMAMSLLQEQVEDLQSAIEILQEQLGSRDFHEHGRTSLDPSVGEFCHTKGSPRPAARLQAGARQQQRAGAGFGRQSATEPGPSPLL